MLIYHPDIDIKLSDFGVGVPLWADRAARTFDYLRKYIVPKLCYTKDIVPLNETHLLLAHHPDYVLDLMERKSQQMVSQTYEVDSVDNPLELIRRTLAQAGGSYLAMERALERGWSYFLGGGMHHARHAQGSGFCLINDIVIGLRRLGLRSWVVDVDAHKGDGTAELTQHDDLISTLSIHMKDGWPFDGTTTLSDIPSNIDIPIGVGQESEYLKKLHQGLEQIENADLVVVVNGADPYQDDRLASSKLLQLSKEQMLARDMMLFDYFHDKNIPIAFLMSGGYGPNSWQIYAQFLEQLKVARGVALV